MTYDQIKFEAGEIATLTLDRPDTGNALSEALCGECLDALDTLGDTTRVLVVRGAGEDFSTGGDIGEMETEDPEPTEQYAYIDENGHELVRRLRELPQPVVASVSGNAVGAGFNLALACDIVLADRSARFGQVFANIGLHPDCGGTLLLPAQVGMKNACELIFTGDIIGAEEAAELGAVNDVVPEGELSEAVQEMAERIAAGPPVALRLAKESLYENAGGTLGDALDREALAQSFCLRTADFEEGVAAFQEGRQPDFSGR